MSAMRWIRPDGTPIKIVHSDGGLMAVRVAFLQDGSFLIASTNSASFWYADVIPQENYGWGNGVIDLTSGRKRIAPDGVFGTHEVPGQWYRVEAYPPRGSLNRIDRLNQRDQDGNRAIVWRLY